MDDDARVPESGAHLLASFFASASIANHPAVRARVPRVRAHLLTYLDTEAERWVTPDEMVLVHAERQLDPVDAVLRVTGVEVVLAALPGFCHPAWLLPATRDARAQLRVVVALRHWVAERSEHGRGGRAEHGLGGHGQDPLAGPAVPYLLERVDDAVRRAQATLDRSPAP